MPTLTFGMIYCFFVIAHDRRRILHCNTTKNPTAAWISQQLRETFPFYKLPKYLIFDRAANFGDESHRHDQEFRRRTEANWLPKPMAERCSWDGNGVNLRDLPNVHIHRFSEEMNRPSPVCTCA